MDPFFTKLGKTVLARWQKQNFSLAAFPDIAVQALEEKLPSRHVDLPALMKQFLLDDEQPYQSQSPFGQPELIVYDCPHFYIQILFWLEGTIDIHQHKFSGAFHVLEGSSIHSLFEFENAQSVSAHLRVGDLRMKETHLLETGSTIPIVSGGGYVHSLFHLDNPSMTVVIRTHSDPGTGPQYTYLPPHLAVDPFYQDNLTARRKQLLDVLEMQDDPSYVDLVLEMIESLDFERGFFILQNGVGYLRALERWDEVWQAFEARHGELSRYVMPTLDEIGWRDGIVGYRSSITESEHRFFLALLLNVPTRQDILAIVAQRFSEPAVETILRWAAELATASPVGAWILDAEFPADVNVPKKKQADVLLAALGHFLDGGDLPASLKTLTLTDVEHLRMAFAQSSLRALVS